VIKHTHTHTHILLEFLIRATDSTCIVFSYDVSDCIVFGKEEDRKMFTMLIMYLCMRSLFISEFNEGQCKTLF